MGYSKLLRQQNGQITYDRIIFYYNVEASEKKKKLNGIEALHVYASFQTTTYVYKKNRINHNTRNSHAFNKLQIYLIIPCCLQLQQTAFGTRPLY